MLRELGIRNFVLIENLRLDLARGLNVLTGETGAGKSIVLDAVGLLIGDRFRTETVRQGAERASVDGVFAAPKTRAFARWWKEHDFEPSEDIVIRREGYADGRSKAYLNDRPVTLAALEELGAFLVDIHAQNEHQRILQPAIQRELLDRAGGLEAECDAIAPLYERWIDVQNALSARRLSEEERLQRIDLLQFQLGEIDKAKLRAGEEDELLQRLPELKNAEKLRALASGAYDALYEAEGSAVERLGQSVKAFESLAQLAPAVEPHLRDVRDACAKAEEAAHALKTLAERWQADPEALDAALSRLDGIARLKKKYGSTVEAVLAHGESVRAQLSALENSDAMRADLEKQAESARRELEKASLDLSKKRQQAARTLSASVQKQLADLGLKQAVFGIKVESASPPAPLPTGEGGRKVVPLPEGEGGRRPGEASYHFSTTGIDRVTFEWAPNPGEGTRPLKTIVSGGEMSRVMLALKTVLAEADAVPTLVFDEVDAGISGLTAQAVGKKLRALSTHHQILCVSHLPQIASSAHAHIHVSKRVSHARTFAVVETLEEDTRVNELARMLGSALTPVSLQHARELLEQNQ